LSADCQPFFGFPNAARVFQNGEEINRQGRREKNDFRNDWREHASARTFSTSARSVILGVLGVLGG
jgi:hypothetical protein